MEHLHEICRASAGSGKTYQLTTRYLRLIYGGIEPGTILATTFTRKAAGEILGRVLHRLAESVDDDDARADLARAMKVALDREGCAQMLRRVVDAMHRVSIGTLDSFFNRIAQTFSLELALPMNPVLFDDRSAAAEQLRLEAIEAMLGDDDLPTLLDLLRRLQHDSAARSVTRVIDQAIVDQHEAYRSAPLRELWTQLQIPPQLSQDDWQRALDGLTGYTGEMPDKRWTKAYGKFVESALLRDWETVATAGLGAKLAEGSYYSKPFPVEMDAVMRPVVTHAVAMLTRQLAERTAAYFDIIHRFDHHYERLREQQGVMLFSDITHRLAHLLPRLGDDVLLDVYYRLDGRVQHLMLDEFQDTSLDQWRVLEPIAREVTDDWSGERSFYCVGDAKQAIYGWRGGCAELFTHIENTLAGGEVHADTLSKSFRSSQVVLDAVNRVFESLSTNPALSGHAAVTAAWDARYQAHTAARTLAGYVCFESTPGDQDTTAEREDEDEQTLGASGHERCVAERIKAIHEADPSRSIGVLVLRNKMIPRLLYELYRVGVEASGEGGHSIADVPAVAAILSALTLADHPGDTVAAFHAANSPVGELLGLRGTRRTETVETGLQIRKQLLEHGYPAVLAEWAKRLAGQCDASNLRGVEQLVELAETYDPAATLRVSDFVRFVQSSSMEQSSSAKVRLMTVHGAKGLGFDAVVLPDLDAGLRLRSELLIDREEPTHPVRGVYANPNSKLLPFVPQLQPIAEKSIEAQLNEQLCKLYVAVTRPVHALYVMTQSKKPRGVSFSKILMHGLTGRDDWPSEPEVIFESGDADWMRCGDRKIVELPPPAQPIRLDLSASTSSGRSWAQVSPSSFEGEGKVTAEELLRLDTHSGRAFGAVIHACFEQVGYIDEGPEPDVSSVEGLTPQIAQEFDAMLKRPAIRSALERHSATELWREQPFAVRDGERLLRGVFDRVVIEPGRAMILDFKTDRIDDATRDAVVDTYRPQMQAYRRALEKLSGLEASAITCQLLFVGSGEVVVI